MKYKIVDESNHNGPCFVIRREYGANEWEWVCWHLNKKEAEKMLFSLTWRDRIEKNEGSTVVAQQIYIPENDYGVPEGYYSLRGPLGIVALLRKHKDNPEIVQFIADMLE